MIRFLTGISTKAWLIAGAVAMLLAGVAWLRHDAVQGERARDREKTIERERDISDAINSCRDLHWTERLQCAE